MLPSSHRQKALFIWFRKLCISSGLQEKSKLGYTFNCFKNKPFEQFCSHQELKV